MSEELNKQRNRRGLNSRQSDPENRAKNGQPSLNRSESQYLRSCDSRVGKWFRLKRPPVYSFILRIVDRKESANNAVGTR